MRIEAVELRRIRIPFRRPFAHAAHERHGSDALLVSVHDDQHRSGWGEILPRPYVTGETIEQVWSDTAPALAHAVLGRVFADFEGVAHWLDEASHRVGRGLAALCGFDLALVDLAGHAFRRSAAEFLGGRAREELPAGVIVGFDIPTDKLARYCAALRLAGKRHVKVKVGRGDDDERLHAIASVFKDVPLRLDANGAWSAQETIVCLRRWNALPIASIEQPVAADDLEGLRAIRQATGVAVMVDESLCTLEDAERIARENAADIFNIRLGKNGGLLASRRLLEIGRRAGMALHLGTMVGETGILSRASEVFGACSNAFACLDGKGQSRFLLARDILDGDGVDGAHRWPGLGVRISLQAVHEVQVGETCRLA